MSQVYSTEPQTSGSVVFETTHGPLSIHLWCKECPYTVRFFLQLCIDGFYDNLVFHRIVPNFLIQTGDSRYRQNGDNTGSNNNDENETDASPWKQPPSPKYREQHQAGQALSRRQYELNSRIRFNHRGQIAMALGIEDNDNDSEDKSLVRLQPQFFVTLDEASHLDGKHVCFGGITGPTIFNALRIGQTDIFHNESDETDHRNFQPRIVSEAPRILRTKIVQIDLPPTLPVLAPTQDISILPWKIDPTIGTTTTSKDGKKRKKKNRKGVKNINLLSFGEEMEEEEGSGALGKNKIKSSHDILVSTTLSTKEIALPLENETSSSTLDAFPKDNPEASTKVVRKPKGETPPSIDHGISQTTAHDGTMSSTMDTTKALIKDGNQTVSTENTTDVQAPTFSSRNDRKAAERIDSFPQPNIDGELAKLKKKDHTKKISLVEARRAKYVRKNTNKKGSSKQEREDETMARFKAFQQKFTHTTINSGRSNEDKDGAPATYHGQILEKDDSEGLKKSSDWMRTNFKCRRHMDHDAKNMGGDGRGVHDYEVIEERSAPTDRKPGKRKRHHHGNES